MFFPSGKRCPLNGNDSTERVAIATLVEDPANARKHNKKNLAAIKGSLARFGQQKPIVISANNVVIAGNGTLAAAQELGWSDIWCYRSQLTGSDATAFAIADNRTAELADWEAGVLSETLKALKDEFDLSTIGFDDKDLARMIAMDVKPGLTDDDEIPEQVETRAKLGDIWLLGEHRVMCGDSTDVLAVERLMAGDKANVFLSDPPYGVSYAGKNAFLNAKGKGNKIQVDIENDHGTLDETGEVWLTAYSNALLNSHDDASFYIFSPQGGDLMMMMMIQKAGWTLKHMLVWVKNNHVLGRCDYHYKHEPIFYGWAKTHKFYGGSSCFSVLEFPKPQKNDLHPTMKPIELIAQLVANSTKPKGLVLDLFLGSGSTLIACEKLGRRCYGMELDPHYVDVIITRWEKFTGKTATLEMRDATPLSRDGHG